MAQYRLTIRQLALCDTIFSIHKNRLTVENAIALNQLIFGSLCRRKLILYHNYFFLTKEALEACALAREWQPFRKNNNLPLSKFTNKLLRTRR